MKQATILPLVAALFALSACATVVNGDKVDKTIDQGIDAKPLTQLRAGIWIDPTGCDHWIIDDGVEGYLSQRLDRNGKPVCSGPDLANTAIGDLHKGTFIPDPV